MTVKFELPQISEQQQTVIKHIQENKNIVVNSVAGSGKTTTILYIAQQMKDKKILLLTFNKDLKQETREKVEQLDLKNIETHSYHSCACKYYDKSAYKDIEIQKILEQKKKNKKNKKWDILILDETQDMSPLYYELILKLLQDNNITPNICILGDEDQAIFQFNNADNRFIKFGNKIFDQNDKPWEQVDLSVSYRLTQENAKFINKCLLKQDKIQSIKNGKKPKYIICDCFNMIHGKKYKPYEDLIKLLDEYKYDDIFILAPSMKGDKSPVRILANELTKKKIPIYVPENDEQDLVDDDILKGKIVFSTYHQTKGLERKLVIIFNFDDSYFRFYKKKNDINIYTKEQYVAGTRASEQLILYHHYQNDFFKFLNINDLKQYCDYEEDKKIKLRNNIIDNNDIKTKVTEITKHLPQQIIDDCLKYLKIEQINEKQEKIEIGSKIKQQNTFDNNENFNFLYENVSNITGIAIPSWFELITTNKLTIFDILDKNNQLDDMQIIKQQNNDKNQQIEHDQIYEENNLQQIKNIIQNNPKQLTPQQLLYLANKYQSYTGGYNYKLQQIQNYDWLTYEQLQQTSDRLKQIISGKAIYEINIDLKNKKELFNRQLVGIIDCLYDNNIYEFKCVNELQSEHYIQLAIYQYMFETIKQDITDNLDTEIQILQLNKQDDLQQLMKNKQQMIDRLDDIKTYKNINNNNLDKQNIEIQDLIEFKKDNILYQGQVMKKFGNGNIDIKTLDNKKIKILKKDNIMITKNLLIDEKIQLEQNIQYLDEQINNINTQYDENTIKLKTNLSKTYNYYLLNILTNEKIKINTPLDKLKQMMEYILYHKYIKDNNTTDEQFTDIIDSIRCKY